MIQPKILSLLLLSHLTLFAQNNALLQTNTTPTLQQTQADHNRANRPQTAPRTHQNTQKKPHTTHPKEQKKPHTLKHQTNQTNQNKRLHPYPHHTPPKHHYAPIRPQHLHPSSRPISYHTPRKHAQSYRHPQNSWSLAYRYRHAHFYDQYGYYYGDFSRRGYRFEGKFYRYDRDYTYRDRVNGKGLFDRRYYKPIPQRGYTR